VELMAARVVVPPPPGTTGDDIRAALELEAWLELEEDRQLDRLAVTRAHALDRATRPVRIAVALLGWLLLAAAAWLIVSEIL